MMISVLLLVSSLFCPLHAQGRLRLIPCSFAMFFENPEVRLAVVPAANWKASRFQSISTI